MKKPILLAITAYQRYISPYKGFHCAFHAHTGRDTCSGYGYRVFARYGTLRGWRLLRRRFTACSAQAALHRTRSGQINAGSISHQGGFIDCGGCDSPSCEMPSCGDVLDIAECCGELEKKRRTTSCREWDCADWLNFLLLIAVIAGVAYLIWRFLAAP